MENPAEFDYILIKDATENNLKHVTVKIPKRQITVVTGVSGSGKSSLVLDTIAAKSRRELNDTFPSFTQQYLPKYGRPHVGDIENLPIAIVIEQRKPTSNSRSTVGTYTDIYALLRLLFSRIGQPFVGYSDAFSFNHPSGSCPRCAGLGEIRGSSTSTSRSTTRTPSTTSPSAKVAGAGSVMPTAAFSTSTRKSKTIHLRNLICSSTLHKSS